MVQFDLESVIKVKDPTALEDDSLADLRTLRSHYESVENGLSYARRMVQGRLDTVMVELDRRQHGGSADEVLSKLPEALAAHTRGPGTPRPAGDLDPPEWADELIDELDELLTPSDLSQLSDLPSEVLQAKATEIGRFESELSSHRHGVHRLIDEVQNELVGRYQAGASVDDLLS